LPTPIRPASSPMERLLEAPEHAYRLLGLGGAGALTGAGTPQTKVAYGTGRRRGGEGCLAQRDSIHRTRGSGPGGDTGSTNIRT
jgi:hypothetical protein